LCHDVKCIRFRWTLQYGCGKYGWSDGERYWLLRLAKGFGPTSTVQSSGA
jgi:hypothetical protein